MKFLVVCLFAILGAAVAMPVEGDTVKEPVPLIVSDYSSVAKDSAAAVPESVAPVASEEAKAEAVESTDAPVTEPSADEAEKEFANEVKQEEKLLRTVSDEAEDVAAVTENVVEAKEEPSEDAPATTEPAALSDEAPEPVQVDAKTVEEEVRSEEAAATTVEPEFVPAKDAVSRRRRDTEEDQTESVEAVTDTVKSAEVVAEVVAEEAVESRTESDPEPTTVSNEKAESS
ncbi:MARCKS-related protein 1-A-like [Cloeon dipterum]|uniref:MARCKS-related protein 1-A-like n=1 Tax=Cloeon dipterum TaxID=197152 RepID=UPI00321FF46B